MTTSNMTTSSPTIILIAGHWLGAWAWDEVIPSLTSDSSKVIAMTLPGFDRHDIDRAHKSLDDQATAILETITGSEGAKENAVVLVAHSGANAPVSIVLDRHPELVQRIVWVDSGPVASGTIFMPDLQENVTELPLPGFEVLAQQANLDGLDSEALELFRVKAVPVPAPVLREPVVLSNEQRRQVPSIVVCCSLSSTRVREFAQAGHPMFAEVAYLEDYDFVDLPTGHWPMWSRPGDLAKIISAAVGRGCEL